MTEAGNRPNNPQHKLTQPIKVWELAFFAMVFGAVAALVAASLWRASAHDKITRLVEELLQEQEGIHLLPREVSSADVALIVEKRVQELLSQMGSDPKLQVSRLVWSFSSC